MTTSSPILQAELRHQRFVIRRSRSGWLWIALAAAMVIPSVVASLVFSGALLISPFIPEAIDFVRDNSGWWFTILMIVNLSLYPVVTLITLGLSANSIQREKTGNTWDTLRLTHISHEQIVIGKWLASLRALFGDHLMAMVVRIGWIATLLSSGVTLPSNPAQLATFSIGVHFLLFVIITITYSVLDAAFTAALGIVSALPESFSGMGGMVILVLRGALMIVQFGWFAWTVGTALSGRTEAYILMSIIGFVVYSILVTGTLALANRLVE